MDETDDWRLVHEIGHRNFIGGSGDYWDIIGKLQFDLLVSKGLSPHHVLLDIGCGSLRGGTRLIDYLQPEKYIAVDKHIELIIYGVAEELGIATFRAKRPRFVVTSSFEFDTFSEAPQFAIAQSLFSHFSTDDVRACLAALRRVAAPECRFFATFFERTQNEKRENPSHSHSRLYFSHTRDEMESIGSSAGWKTAYIDDWSHPRGQRLIEFTS